MTNMLGMNLIDIIQSGSEIFLSHKASSKGFVFSHDTEIGCLNGIIKGENGVVNVKGTDGIVCLRDDKMLLYNLVTIELSEFAQ